MEHGERGKMYYRSAQLGLVTDLVGKVLLNQVNLFSRVLVSIKKWDRTKAKKKDKTTGGVQLKS